MTHSVVTVEEVETLCAYFEDKMPEEIIAWAVEKFPTNIALSSSFQSQSMPLLHMVSRIKPDIRILFLETGYHFWETLIFRESLERIWDLNVVNLYMDEIWMNFSRRFGKDLPIEDPNLCCYIHKVHPMQKALKGLNAWITGIRRDQTAVRANAKALEVQSTGLLKINPMLNWTRDDVWEYIREHNLPVHPLYERGYFSIGCVPCTRPVLPGEADRAGRWDGRGKSECGLHSRLYEQEEFNPEEVDIRFTKKMGT